MIHKPARKGNTSWNKFIVLKVKRTSFIVLKSKVLSNEDLQ